MPPKTAVKSLLAANSKKKIKFTTVVALAVAVPLLAATFAVMASMQVHHKVNTHRIKQEENNNDARIKDPSKNHRNGESSSIGTNVHYHIIFSTGCSIFQDWQSYIFFYHAKKSKQPGTITRIVSGCKPDEQTELQRVFDEQIANLVDDGRFRIHFTPDYSMIKPSSGAFKYFNKPFGVHHWLENGLGFPEKASQADRDSIVILMDPDQIIMRPFQNNDFSNTAWQFLEKGEVPRTMVDHGKPMGQQYGFGLQWKNKVNMSSIAPLDEQPSPVDTMDYLEAHKGYIVGPPYVATGSDMYKITTKWTQFAIPVHDQYPHLLAEMFAYCLSAAHQKLAHQTAASFMVSDIHTGRDEGWSYIDKFTMDNVCRRPDDYNPEELPNVLHFCQRYALGTYFFGKYRLPKKFLTCESPLLVEPPLDFVRTVNKTFYPDGTIKVYDEKDSIRNAFMVCYMIFSMNEAAIYWKQRHCDGKGNMVKAIDYKSSIG